MSVQITPKADFLVVEFGHDLTIFTVRDCYEALKKLASLKIEMPFHIRNNSVRCTLDVQRNTRDRLLGFCIQDLTT